MAFFSKKPKTEEEQAVELTVEEQIENEQPVLSKKEQKALEKQKKKAWKNDTRNSKADDIKKKKKSNKKVVRTVQDTLAWESVIENTGIFQIGPKRFSKTYEFNDISFRTKDDDDQFAIYQAYNAFLNTCQPGEDIFFSFINEPEDPDKKLAPILPIERGDQFDEYRKEMSKIIKDKMKESRNSITTRRFLTFIVDADSVDKAIQRVNTLSGELTHAFEKIVKTPMKPVDTATRLEIISDILNRNELNFWFEHNADGKTSLDLEYLAHKGLTPKDVVAPDYMKFYGDRFEINEGLGQAMYLSGVANWLNANFISSLIEVSFPSVFSLHISPIDQGDAINKVGIQALNVSAEIEAKMDARVAAGKDPNLINADLRKRQETIESLQDDIANRDQKLFYANLTAVHFADDLDTLKTQQKELKKSAEKMMCKVSVAFSEQERALMTALPLGQDKLLNKEVMYTTESLGIMMPFDEVNKFDKHGLYYGVNAINKSLIVYDRWQNTNYNALFLGASGTGKSFSAKREIFQVFLNNPDADIYIIDPDGEYTPLADSLAGSVINISPGNGVYLNPFDLDTDTSADPGINPVTMKADFICGILETMIGYGGSLSPTQKSIVGRCIQEIYRPYLEHLAELPPDANGKRITIDREYCPTMQNLFDSLLRQPQPEAQNLALIMEQYTTGAYDVFAHKTNVDVDNRLIIYNIKNIGSNLKELGLKVCTSEVFNKMQANSRLKKKTYAYFDEAHLLLKTQSSADYLTNIWKRCRKFLGAPAAITQDVEEFLNTPGARAIINNSSFIYLLGQAPINQGILKDILGLSESDVSYIATDTPGRGLIYTVNQTIPFVDEFPDDTQIFKAITTKYED